MPLNNKLLKIKPKFLWLFIANGFLILLILVLFIFNPLTANFPQYDVLDLEFAWTSEKLETIFTAWGDSGINSHRLGVIWDFLFILGYIQFFSGITLLLANYIPIKDQKISGFSSLLPILAGLLDLVEDILLLISLGSSHPIPALIPPITGILAGLKFFSLGIGIFYIIIEGFILISIKIRKKFSKYSN